MLYTFTEYVGEVHMLTCAHKQIDLPCFTVLVNKITTRGSCGPAVKLRLFGLAALANYNAAH